jgi:hypothetical protein
LQGYPQLPRRGGTAHALHGNMRRIRRSFHFALTVGGTVLVLYAVMRVESTWDRVLLVLLGLVLIEAGIWRITKSLFPDSRQFRPLRKETDYFVALVRRLNRASLLAQRGLPLATAELDRVHEDMHHSVDRMLRLAGMTEEDLGFRYRPQKTVLPPVQPHVQASAQPHVQASAQPPGERAAS